MCFVDQSFGNRPNLVRGNIITRRLVASGRIPAPLLLCVYAYLLYKLSALDILTK